MDITGVDEFTARYIEAVTLVSTGTTTFDSTLNGISATDFSHFRDGYNMVLNGDMEINQRGTVSVVSDNLYFADRWRSQMDAPSEMTMEKSTTAPLNYNNSMKCTVTSTPTASRYGMAQTIDGSIFKSAFWGTASAKSITVSFWARCSTLLTCSVKIYNSNNDFPVSVNYEPDEIDTWEYKTVTFSAQTSGTYGNDEGSAGCVLEMCTDQLTITNQNLYITGVKMELGGVATPFFKRHDELLLCKKYYQIVEEAIATNNSLYDTMIIKFSFPEMINTPTLQSGTVTFQLSGFGNIEVTMTSGTATKTTYTQNKSGGHQNFTYRLIDPINLDADYY